MGKADTSPTPPKGGETLDGRCAARARRTGARCRLPVAPGARTCRKHGGSGGRPVEHGIYSRLRARYPTIGQLMDADELVSPAIEEQAGEALALIRGIVAHVAGLDPSPEGHVCSACGAMTACELSTDAQHLDRLHRGARDVVFLSTELAKQAKLLTEAHAAKAIAATAQHVVAFLRRRLSPDVFMELARDLRHVPALVEVLQPTEAALPQVEVES